MMHTMAIVRQSLKYCKRRYTFCKANLNRNRGL